VQEQVLHGDGVVLAGEVDVLLDLVLQFQFAGIGELKDGYGRELFGDAADAELAGRAQGFARLEVCKPHRSFIHHLSTLGHQYGTARGIGGEVCVQRRIEIGGSGLRLGGSEQQEQVKNGGTAQEAGAVVHGDGTQAKGGAVTLARGLPG
jgi:hypothetical protein